jgi:molybdopterin converting factor small subunit
MALVFDGLTLIPPEILETCRKNCRIEQLTLGCLRKQLKIPVAYPIVVNGVVQRDMDFVLEQGDRIQVLPTIAGG